MGGKATSEGSYGACSVGTNWVENCHYVVFHDVLVRSDQPWVIQVNPNAQGRALINGLQLVKVAGNLPPTRLDNQPQWVTWTTNASPVYSAAADDGLPADALNYSWRLLSGPGTVTIDGSNQASPWVVYSAPGTYTFELTLDDTDLSSTNQVIVQVNSAPTITDLPPTIVGFTNGYCAFGFTVGDAETIASNLFVQVISRDVTLVPADHILVSGAGSNRWVTLLPMAGRVGWCPLEIRVWDDHTSTRTQCVFVAYNTYSAAQFIRYDTTTQGSWMGHYGAEGYSLLGYGGVNCPHLVTGMWLQREELRVSGYWSDSTTDPRALQRGNDRVAATDSPSWGNTMMAFHLCFDDTRKHRVAFYALDWDQDQRSQRLEIIDGLYGTLLGTQDFTQFGNGIYQVWDLTGNVFVRVTRTGVGSAVMSGIFFDVPNEPPVIQPLSSQCVAFPNSVFLQATVTDDGYPLGHPLTFAWTKLTGPGQVNFANAASLETVAGFSTNGIYTLRLTASDSQLATNADVTIYVNAAPMISSLTNQIITWPAQSVTLNPTVTDDGLPYGQTNLVWSNRSPFGAVTFGNPNAAQTTATFNAVGIYTLRLTAGDGQLTAFQEVTIRVEPDPNNPDSDQDGLPDWWELQYFGNVLVQDGNSDYNEDGITNLQHYQHNTDPRARMADDTTELILKLFTPLKH